MISAIHGMLVYASICGQVPEMHPFLLGNPLFPVFIPSMETWNQVLQFTLKAVNSRTSLQRDGELELEKHSASDGKDMLFRWMTVHNTDPQKLSTRDIIVHLSTNVFAGSDTTAIALRAVFYFLMRHPHVLAKVRDELDTAEPKLSNPISYRESVTYLPYLTAVLKESMRLHPSVGLILEREVPSPGITICDQYIPAGTVVGINAWVVHRNAEIYPDPDAFIPERWIDSAPEKLREMEQAFFNFGAGARSCVGRNISLMEMQKVVPQLLREFEVRLWEEREWRTRNVWFVVQDGVVCELVPRKAI